jgi:outer membrane protein assembly factor BamB
MRFIIWLGLAVGLSSRLPIHADDDWPQFRGPRGNGHADATKLPLTWNATNHVTWKTAVHDLGWSSPVVCGDQVWVTTATEDGAQLFAVCLHRKTGKVTHDIKVFNNEHPEHVAAVNSYASPTPVIEPGRIYVHYGTYGTACLDTAGGNVIWARRDLNCDHHEGPGASPVLCRDLLIVNVDGRDVQYVIALDKRTGKTVWKTNRSVDLSEFPINCRKAFCTPTIIEVAGRPQLFSPGAKAMFAYDPLTGKERWKVRYHGWSVTPRPVFGHGLLYVITDYERPELWAVRPDGTGDVTDTHVSWKITKEMPATVSLLLIDDLLFMINDQGTALGMDAKSGNVQWRLNLKARHSASPIYAAGRIYCFSEKGLGTVIDPSAPEKIQAENPLGERLMATPAVAGSSLIIRTKSWVYCVGGAE